MNILIVGGGKLVYYLCRTFISKGYNLTLINKDEEDCSWLARRLKATVAHGDGTDLKVLEECGAEMFDAILAVTGKDQDNLAICQLAKHRFNIPRTLAMVNDPDNEEVFKKLGVTDAFSTTRVISSLIEQRTGFEDVVNLFPLEEGKVNLTEVILNRTSPVIGKALADISLPENSLIAIVTRNGSPIIPRGGTTLQSGDSLVVITMPDNLGRVIKLLTGEK
jgi:trk system potassium uptake protein TrkA